MAKIIFTKAAAPAAPSASEQLVLYADTADAKFKYKNSSNTVTSFGEMNNFSVSGDSGDTDQTISDGDTLIIAGGDGITTAASNTDTLTVTLDLTKDQAWTGIQRAAFEGTVNTNGVFDLSTGHNFKCTPAASATITLTFTGESSGSLSPHNGQSGYIYLTNDGSVTVQGDTTTHHDGTILSTLSGSTAAKYLISYICDGTNVFITNSAAIAAGVS